MIIILGGHGYIGQALQRHLEAIGEPFRVLSRADVDCSDPARLLEMIRSIKPRFLINAAGYTGKPNVDACELHKSECLAGNAVLPGIVREVCETAGLRWGHVSSGCIYTGRREDGGGFTEGDPPNFSFRTNNCSFYSGTKALGEEVLAGAENCYLWRLRIPFDHRDNPRNYLTKLLTYDRLLDVENSITHLDDFARICWESFSQEIPPGIYNVTNTGAIMTREVVALLQEHLESSRTFNFFESEAEFMAKAAKTPRSNCVLDNSKLRRSGIQIDAVEDALVRAMKSLQSGQIRALKC